MRSFLARKSSLKSHEKLWQSPVTVVGISVEWEHQSQYCDYLLIRYVHSCLGLAILIKMSRPTNNSSCSAWFGR